MNKHYMPKSIAHHLNSWREGDALDESKHKFEGRAGVCTGFATLSSSLDGSGFFVEGGLRVLGSSQYVHENFPFHGAIPISTRLASRQGGLECMSAKHRTSFESSIHHVATDNPRQTICNVRNRIYFGFDIADVKFLQFERQVISCRQLVSYLLSKNYITFPFEPSSSYPRKIYLGEHQAPAVAWKSDVVVLKAHHLFNRHDSGHLAGLARWIETSNHSCVSGVIAALAADEGYSVETKFFNGTVVGESKNEDVVLPGVELSLMSIVQIPESKD